MKKIYAFLAAALMSVSVFAAKDVVPTDAVLADYYNQGDVCVCFYVPAEMNCNNIVLTGSFNGWKSTAAECVAVKAVEGYDGWYVGSFTPEAEPDATRGIQAKPIMLDVDGNFNWDYQIGAATAIRGCVTVQQGAYAGEIDMINYGADAPNVFTVDAWKKNPCTAILHNYTIMVISDGCNNLAVPYIAGGMNGWNFQQMQLDQAKTLEYQVPVYTTTFKAAESTPYQILSGLMDTTGQIIEAPSWNDIARMQKLVDDVWARIPGEDGDNQLTHENANIVWDLRDSTLRWARCEEGYPVKLQVKLPALGCPEAVEIIGTFDDWSGTAMELLESGWFFVELEAKASQYFKFRSAGSWDHDIEIYRVANDEWTRVLDNELNFGQLWHDSIYNGMSCKWIEIDMSDPTYYRWGGKYNLNVICDNNKGRVTGSGQYNIGAVLIDATPNYGYHFTQWNDSVTDNPRTIVLTQDTTFTAEFAVDRTGKCGDNLALTWVYEPESKTLTISGEGALNTNYTFGVEAPTQMQALVIEYGVTSIGSSAFSGCSGLTSVIIPNSVTSIGGGAFASCSGLTSIMIPNSVTVIGGYAFYQCTGLTSVTIPNSVTSIGYSAFYDCTSLTSVIWDAKNCSNHGGFGSQVTSFVFGNEVETIPAYCCSDMNITSITIPNSVTSIGEYAFRNCSGLTSVTIGNNVTSIGDYAFYGCSGLTSVTIGNSVTSIGSRVFYNCSGLISMEAPAGFFDIPEADWLHYTKILSQVTINAGELTENALLLINRSYKTLQTLDVSGVTNTEFADEAFKGYYNLQQLVLPAGLQQISYNSVAECIKLKSVVIPAGVTEIDDRAFEACRSLDSVNFAGEALRRIGNWAFYNCHALENIEIPEGVTEIGAGAFYGCTYLNNLSMPASVQSIGDNAFALCSKISQMDVDAVEPPTVEDKTFYEVSTEAPVYVPDASVTTYKAHPVWGRLNIIGKSDSPQGIDNANTNVSTRASKILHNGQILILRGDKTYTIQGQEVK